MSRAASSEAAVQLSVIVPMRNEAEQMPALLDQLAALNALGAECLLVDGGSDDGSAAIARGARFTVLDSPAGRARQMNLGARQAHGRWLLFLHADTRLPLPHLPGLSSLTDGLGNEHDCEQIIWGRYDVRISGRSIWLPLVARMMNLRSRWTGIATGDQAIFVRRDVFVALGGYADQALMEDIELSRRLRRLARPLCVQHLAQTSGRRWDRDGAWPTILLMWGLRLAYALGVSPRRLARWYR